MRTLIVDGYNVIHAWPELRAVLQTETLERARDQLLRHMAEYAAQTGVAVTVVFDANVRRTGEPSQEVIDGVTVLFATRTASADHVIERLAQRSARRGAADEVTVATNDRLQRAMVGSMGVATISAVGLHEEVQRVRGDVTRTQGHLEAQRGHANRVEHRLDADVVARLERLRRGEVPNE
jgi:predicted RNA-binding protein with PIN domain